MMNMCVGLDNRVFIDHDAASLSDAPEIASFQIEQHDMLGALLRMRAQCRDDLGVVAEARMGACNRTCLYLSVSALDQSLG